MLQIARTLPVNTVRFDTKQYYCVYVGDIPIWVHHSLVENNMLVLKGKRFYLDMVYALDNSINYYLYPGENNLTVVRSPRQLYISDGAWIMSNHNGAFYYLIEHNQDIITVNNTIETFEIKDNRIISVERHAVYGRIEEEIDLDGEW
jgi:hypothetical protein